MSGPAIAVIGDALLDVYYQVELAEWDNGINSQAHRIISAEACPGGAANVAAAVVGAGQAAALYSVIGDDDPGSELLSLLRDRSVEVAGVRQSLEFETRVLARFMGDGANLPVRVDYRRRLPFRLDHPASHNDRRIEFGHGIGDSLRASCSGVIVADYGGLLTGALARQLVDTCAQFNLPILVDPSRGHGFWYRGCTVVQLNSKEVKARDEHYTDSEHSLIQAAARLLDEFESRVAVVTLAERGVIVATADGVIRRPSYASAAEVVNTTGAGDAFAAGFMADFVQSANVESAVDSALAAARRAVMTRCTCPVYF